MPDKEQAAIGSSFTWIVQEVLSRIEFTALRVVQKKLIRLK